MSYFKKKMEVHKKVPIPKCKDDTGKMPTKVRWVDTNKQDEIRPKYRSRSVAKEGKTYADVNLHAVSQLIDMLRTIVSIASTRRF